MAYQSFENERGDSDSFTKLAAMQFPESMEGKSFLDLGCNEGFFCMEAKRRGAGRVVGLDMGSIFIQRAKDRAKKEGMDIEYINDIWANLPEGKFDFILMSSALHYEHSPIELMERIYEHLTDDGVFILESGFLSDVYSPPATFIPRVAGSCFHPRKDVLMYSWLKKFAVRFVGYSVMQDGDPVVRGVFHCRKWKTTVIFISGQGDIGKSNLAYRVFDTKNIIAVDALFYGRFMNVDYVDPSESKEESRYRACYLEHKGNIEETWEILKNDEKAWVYFTQILLKAIRLQKGSEYVVVEGAGLESMLPVVTRVLEDEGFKVWVLRKG